MDIFKSACCAVSSITRRVIVGKFSPRDVEATSAGNTAAAPFTQQRSARSSGEKGYLIYDSD